MKQKIYLLLAVLAIVIVPFLVTRQSPQARAANRIRSAYLAAEAPMHSDGGLPKVEWFLGKLKEIDVSEAPEDVQCSFTAMLIAVEANANTWRTRGDTNVANERVGMAKRDLIRALDKWRGQPF